MLSKTSRQTTSWLDWCESLSEELVRKQEHIGIAKSKVMYVRRIIPPGKAYSHTTNQVTSYNAAVCRCHFLESSGSIKKVSREWSNGQIWIFCHFVRHASESDAVFQSLSFTTCLSRKAMKIVFQGATHFHDNVELVIIFKHLHDMDDLLDIQKHDQVLDFLVYNLFIAFPAQMGILTQRIQWLHASSVDWNHTP